MAINVVLYSFVKRENSTKQPVSGGTTYSCTMIDDTSLMNPVFKLSIGSNPIGKNYAYVADFDRYYFIREINTYQNFWYISCECDVLASFKTKIGLGYHYILRSASVWDEDITDTVYPAKINASCTREVPENNYDPLAWSNGHSYIIGVVGEASASTNQFGSMTYYMMDDTVLNTFLHFLMDNVDNWSDLTGEYSPGVQQALLNPMQYIKSCIVLPISVPTGGPRPSNINFGYYTYSVGGSGSIWEVNNTNPILTDNTTTIDIPRHPQAATRGNYLNCQPFSSYDLHVGPFGDIPLDPMLLQRNDAINLVFYFDLISGECKLLVKGDDHSTDIFFNGCCQLGIPINLSQVYVDGLAQTQVETSSIFTMLGAALSGQPSAIGTIANAATSGIQDATRLNYPTVTGLASGGSFIPFHDSSNIYIKCKFLPIVDEDLEEIGRPLCQKKLINNLSGYILCQNADCEIAGTQAEAQKVNNYLNTGFFYE